MEDLKLVGSDFDSAILMFVTVKGSRFDNSDYLKHEDVDVNEFKLG